MKTRSLLAALAWTLALLQITTGHEAVRIPSTMAPANAAEAQTPAPPVIPEDPPFIQSLFDAFRAGTIHVNARLRYEFVDQNPTPAKEAHALTLRTRLGYATAPLRGFQGMLEFENVTALSNDKLYRLPGSAAHAERPVIADPESTEVNQAWLSYSNWNSTAKGGRQRIALDNHRFIGDVGWRQNQQTFDAVTVSSSPAADFGLYYGYVWEVNRVFGDVDEVGAAFGDFDSSSHLGRVSYTAWPLAQLTGYSYLLDLENLAGHGQSSATFGASLVGSHRVDAERPVQLGYRAEYAYQVDFADQPADYSAHYVHAELNGGYDRFTLGTGYELLGSGSNRNVAGGRVGFKTPLATLHAFNGWADVFLVTPDDGLQDLYVFAGVRLPGEIPLRVIYHKYESHRGGADLGYELDVVASRSFGKHLTALLKYAYYDGKQAAPPAVVAPFDKHVAWAQVEFNF
jgi:hypothetical protein